MQQSARDRTGEPAPPSNLPASVSPFVGRQGETEVLARLLRSARLLTITGCVGIGKTRLAIELAQAARNQFPDGVWLVELDRVRSPELLERTLAEALGLADDPARPPRQSLLRFLDGRRMLLILDNCEHLISASATLTEDLLRAAPNLRTLATSREPLAIQGEVRWPLAPLSLPDCARSVSFDEAVASEAVKLFVLLARSAQPGFELTEVNLQSVVQLCCHLDGLPLALELAAARIPSLTAKQMLEHLDERFRLLSSWSRTVPARQQTLEAAVSWSYELLSPPEQALFRRLSMFCGIFTLDAALPVAPVGDATPTESNLPLANDGADAGSVVNLLDGLVRKSVLVPICRHNDVHFRLLETLREYGRGRLRAHDEWQQAAGLHAEFYLRQSREIGKAPWGAGLSISLRRLEEQLPDLRQALGWLTGNGRGEDALQITAWLWSLWYLGGHLVEGREWLERALAASPERVSHERGEALLILSGLAWAQGDLSATLAAALAGGRVMEAIGASDQVGYSLSLQALVARDRGDVALAETFHRRALTAFEEAGHAAGAALQRDLLGVLARITGDHAAAEGLHSAALTAFEALGASYGQAMTLTHFGDLRFQQGSVDAAADHYRRALALLQRLGQYQGMGLALAGLAAAAACQEREDSAARWYGAAEALIARGGARVPAAERVALDALAVAADRAEPEGFARCKALGAAQPEAIAAQALQPLLESSQPASAAASSVAPAGDAHVQRSLNRARSNPALSSTNEFDELVEVEPLTPREQEILHLLGSGLNTRQIAKRDTVSVRTVENHVASIYRKLHVHNRAQAVTYASRSSG